MTLFDQKNACCGRLPEGKNNTNLNIFSNYKVLFKSIFPKTVSAGKIPLL